MAETNENIRNFPHQLSLRVSGSGDSENNTGGSHFDGRLLTADDLAREQAAPAAGTPAKPFPWQVSLQHAHQPGEAELDLVNLGDAAAAIDHGTSVVAWVQDDTAASAGGGDFALITDFNIDSHAPVVPAASGDLLFG